MPRRSIVLVLALAFLAPTLPAAGALTSILTPEDPIVDFVWHPTVPTVVDVVEFTSHSISRSSFILLHEWRIETPNGTLHLHGASVSVTFSRPGSYNATLTVTDAALRQASMTRAVWVAHTPPRAAFDTDSDITFRGVPVSLRDNSTDIDGDAIVNWTWDLGDGSVAFGPQVAHAYTQRGTFAITLTVEDEGGDVSSATSAVRVLNRPPQVTGNYTPQQPIAGDVVTFRAEGVDPDLPGGAIHYTWSFSDGGVLEGQQVSRVFGAKGNYTVMLRGEDSEGGMSAPHVFAMRVGAPAPVAAFTFSPSVPTVSELVQFTDTSVAPGSTIAARQWDFGDGASSSAASPSHVYATNGTYLVRLTVFDGDGRVSSVEHPLRVNLAPHARFVAPSGTLSLGQSFQLVDASTDADGVIVNWTWSFGDGRLSFGQDPGEHAYHAPGSYLVQLSVRDDQGATGAAARIVEVANARPVALWTLSAEPQERGQPFVFDGSASHDPDGAPIASWSWSFGDAAQGSGAQAEHTYARSGIYLVGLVVSDGAHTSARTTESHKLVRVGASHDVVTHVTASRPDGSPIDLSDARYEVRARLNGLPPLAPELFAPNGLGLDVRVPKDMWLHGMVLTLAISFEGTSVVRQLELRDHVPTLSVHVPLPLRATVALEVEGDAAAADGTPIVSDPLASPGGSGRLRWADGADVAFGAVVVEARYVGLRAAQGARDGAIPPPLGDDAAGWCVVDLVMSDEEGAFEWRFDDDAPCLTARVDALAPGRWEVRARAPFANGVSGPRAFLVDPTGGALVAASFGLA